MKQPLGDWQLIADRQIEEFQSARERMLTQLRVFPLTATNAGHFAADVGHLLTANDSACQRPAAKLACWEAICTAPRQSVDDAHDYNPAADL